jgi:PKD repeat protein
MEHNLKANMSEVVSVERFSIQYDHAAGRWIGYIGVDSSTSSLNWTMYKVGNTDFQGLQSDINTFSEWTTVKKVEDLSNNAKDGLFLSHPDGQSTQKYLFWDDIGSGFGLDVISDAGTASGGAFFDSGATDVTGIRDTTSLTYSDYNLGTVVYDAQDGRYIHIQSFQQSGDTEKETYQVAKNLTTDTIWNRTNTRTYSNLYSPPKNNRRYHDYVFIDGQEYWVYSEDSDGDNVYSTFISDNSEPNSAPSATFSYDPSSPRATESISFSASDSTDSDGSISSYEWDFDGDGSYEKTAETASHSFSDEGDYTVTLRITDNEGATDTVTKTVSVVNGDPSADFSYSPSDFDTGEDVTFNASPSSDYDGDSLSFEWDTDNDGTFEKTGETITESFSDNVNYDITLKVTDSEGATDSLTKTVTPNNQPPTADFSILTDPVEANTEILFEDASDDPDGSISSTTWYVSGSQVSTGNDLSYTFDSKGDYLIEIEVTDDDGSTDTYQEYVTVQEGDGTDTGGTGGSGLPENSDIVVIAAVVALIVGVIAFSGGVKG